MHSTKPPARPTTQTPPSAPPTFVVPHHGRGRVPMAVLLAVGCAGVVGALCRYLVELALPTDTGRFPIGTFVFNVSGSALLGLLLVTLNERFAERRLLGPFVGSGLIGAYTIPLRPHPGWARLHGRLLRGTQRHLWPRRRPPRDDHRPAVTSPSQLAEYPHMTMDPETFMSGTPHTERTASRSLSNTATAPTEDRYSSRSSNESGDRSWPE